MPDEFNDGLDPWQRLPEGPYLGISRSQSMDEFTDAVNRFIEAKIGTAPIRPEDAAQYMNEAYETVMGRVYEREFLPENEIWFVNGKGEITRFTNIGKGK